LNNNMESGQKSEKGEESSMLAEAKGKYKIEKHL